MGVGERRGGRRGGHRRAHRHNHHHHHRNRRRNRRHGGRGGGAMFVFRPGGGSGTYTPKQSLLMLLFMICMFTFISGMTMANIGWWTSTVLGTVGMVMVIISFIFLIVFFVLCCQMKKNLAANPVGGVEAGNGNMTVSTVTLGSNASYIPPGGAAMGTPGYNQPQPGYPGGPAQPYPQPAPNNYPVAPYPPPNPNGALHYSPPTNPQYPPPTNPQYPPPPNPTAAPMPYPQTGAPPINYTTLDAVPPPPTDSHMGVVPASGDNGVAPPPTYNDVMAGNVKYDEGAGSGTT